MGFEYGKIKCGEFKLENKSCFYQLSKMSNNEIDEMIDEIVKMIEEHTEPNESYSNENKIRKTLEFTIVETDNSLKIGREEEAIERMIVCGGSRYCNQYNFNENEKADLILIDNNENILEMIELKQENSSDSPLYALVEIIKNFYLSKKLKTIKELSILAPKKYFDNFFKEQEIYDKFIEIKQKLEKKIGVPIKLKEVNFNSSDVLDAIFESKYTKKQTLKENEVKEIAKALFEKIGGLKIEEK